ncbi:MAG: nitrate- and nitrite sensing domain-containing protein [Methylococcaceae bacterium]
MATNITFTSSLRSKLILIAAIPTLALLYFAGSGVLEKSALSKEMVKLEALVDVSVKIGALVHEMQKERGMSASFVSSKGSKFAAELPLQREQTDNAADTLQTTLKSFDAGGYGDGLKTLLDTAVSGLAELGAKRTMISAFGMNAIESSAYYSKTIGFLLDVPAQLSTLSSHSEISRLASSYSSLLKAKERAGMERALLATVFVADHFTPDTQIRFVKNFSAQDVYTDLFFVYAPDSQKAFYKAKVSGPVVDEVARIKQVAMDKGNASELGIDPVYWFKTVTQKIDLIKEVENKLSGDLLDAAGSLKSDAQRTQLLFIALTLLSVLVTVVLTLLISKRILASINTLQQIAGAIANGDLSAGIELRQKDELGGLFRSINIMRQQLLARITKERKEHDEFLRIKIALDSITSNVMVADNERNIIYMNPAALSMMQKAEHDIRKVLPKFDSGKLLGANMDAFHKHPAHQKELLSSLSSTFRSEINIGGRTFYLIANAINNDEGQRIGSVVEWRDRTAEVIIEQEVAKVVSGAVLGDFNQRIDEKNKEGFFLQLAKAVNELMETSSTGLLLAIDAAEAAGKGGVVIGDVVSTMDLINESAHKMEDIIAAIDSIAFRTNILALNATIEAAHAGEHGKGFTVVAVEVRNLAQRTAAAAKKIKTLIGDSVVKVEDGTKLVATAGLTMKEIVNSINSIRGVTISMSHKSAGSNAVRPRLQTRDYFAQESL